MSGAIALIDSVSRKRMTNTDDVYYGMLSSPDGSHHISVELYLTSQGVLEVTVWNDDDWEEAPAWNDDGDNIEDKLRALQGRIGHRCGSECDDDRHSEVRGTA